MHAYNAFNEFLRTNPEWIFFISFATPLVALIGFVMFFEKSRKKHKVVRKAHKAGLIHKRSERHMTIETAEKRKDVKSDFFDTVNKYYESV